MSGCRHEGTDSKAKLFGCLSWRFADDWRVETPPDYVGNFSEWDALFADTVIGSFRRSLLQRYPE
jgi:hypothetical protein